MVAKLWNSITNNAAKKHLLSARFPGYRRSPNRIDTPSPQIRAHMTFGRTCQVVPKHESAKEKSWVTVCIGDHLVVYCVGKINTCSAFKNVIPKICSVID